MLPHPGGGGETYVDALASMPGYRSDRVFLAESAEPTGSRISIARRALGYQWARAYDILHVHGEVASALCLGGLAARPSVVTLHGLHLVRRLRGRAGAAARVSLSMILRAATRTICVSETEGEDLRGLVARGALRHVVVVHNGVPLHPPVADTQRSDVRAELGIGPSTMVCAWVGSLDERKDPLTPVNAVKDLASEGDEIVLLVAGDGPLRAEVERVASPTEAVRVLGFRDDVQRLLAASDVFVLSSHREGLSFALLEAMAFGLVPVVTDAPGNREAVDDAGIVVPFGDRAAFAQALSELTHTASRRAELAERARQRVRETFSADAMREQTRRVYDDVIGGRRR